MTDLRIGTAGWSIPRAEAEAFPGDGSHLQRYGRVLRCVEINTSFYRPHRRETYARWAAATPADFRFSVKLPRAITHDGRLRGARAALTQFLDEASALGDRLGVLLVQLPGSFAFDARPVGAFFRLITQLSDVPVVCEPRHASWWTPAAERLLRAARISRAAADPAVVPDAALPGGWLGPDDDGAGAVLYRRWHGSPRLYWSSYEPEWLQSRADELLRWSPDAQQWVILDNTASGAAMTNVLQLQDMLEGIRGMAGP